ncbi:hypothetical protein BK026_14340 [Alteromonas sp. V450]|uniref:ankyrin repeat domain-containing protein n=1 Tax=Alteromonas sp. V450 TaxID=1912139 RepID=UPI0008FF777B|nr:ankyrin repeat domain-containing protein [Alteromonas sp. V450]OJF69858.1 hypothetical protein BK026_14340 [Alteromonas sp. V450]
MKVFLLFIIIILTGCSDPQGEIEKLGIPYTQKSFFEQAVYKKDTNLIKLFLNAGLSVEATDESGDTALINAAIRNDFESIKMLIKEFDANVHTKNKYGRDALAAFLDNNIKDFSSIKKITPFMLEHGATLDTYSNTKNNSLEKLTRIHDNYYTKEAHIPLLAQFFEWGYDINKNIKSSYYIGGQRIPLNTYMDAAISALDFELIDLLIEKGAKFQKHEALVNIYRSLYYDQAIRKLPKKYQGDMSEHTKRAMQTISEIAKGLKAFEPDILFKMKYDRDTVGVWMIEPIKLAIEKGIDINKIPYGENPYWRDNKALPITHKLISSSRYFEPVKPLITELLKIGADPSIEVASRRNSGYSFSEHTALTLTCDRVFSKSKPNFCVNKSLIEYNSYFLN